MSVDDGDAAGDIQELVHASGGPGLLAAHTLQLAALAAGRRLTLVTKHVCHSNKFRVSIRIVYWLMVYWLWRLLMAWFIALQGRAMACPLLDEIL